MFILPEYEPISFDESELTPEEKDKVQEIQSKYQSQQKTITDPFNQEKPQVQA